jgi:probable rRNA maturation factor
MLTKPASLVTEVGVTVENRTDIDIGLHQIARLVAFCRQQLGFPAEIAVDVTFVDEPAMTDLHIRFMGLSGPTDVLSFPVHDVSSGLLNPKTLPTQPVLGDIVICPTSLAAVRKLSNGPLVTSSNDAFNINMFTYVVLHGFLHLCGYDHESARDAARMLRRANTLLEKWRGK